MKNYKFPPSITTCLNLLEKGGFQAVVVGGAVRDFFLNKEPKDYDVATNANISEMNEIFKDYKIINTGLKHGTLTVHINHYQIEITSYRGKENSLKEDLYLRDFTFNSMAIDKNYKLYDFYNGKKDLENKIVRCNNTDTFINDPLRILRAIRQAGKYNFRIEDETKKLMMQTSYLLKNVSKERITSELSQILLRDNISNLIKDHLDIFLSIIPELEETIGFEQNNPYHEYDVFEHTLKVLENTPSILELRLAALLHDIGKPKCYSKDDEHIGHFFNHEKVSKEIAYTILKRLKFDNKTIDFVCKLIEYHDYQIIDNKKSLSKLLNKFNDERTELLFELKKADILGQNKDYYYRLNELDEAYNHLVSIIEKGTCFTLKQLAINGNDLINLGISDGKLIGQILNECLNDVLEEKIENNKDALLNKISKMIL